MTKQLKAASPVQSPAKRGPKDAPRLPPGYGAMRDVVLDIDPRIDLTKPIYEQVLALNKTRKAAAE